jgi:hypothetical protein
VAACNPHYKNPEWLCGCFAESSQRRTQNPTCVCFAKQYREGLKNRKNITTDFVRINVYEIDEKISMTTI